MLNSVKKSLVKQTKFLFLATGLFIIFLWAFFYFEQKQRQEALDMARYFNATSAIQPLLFQAIPLNEEILTIFSMSVFEGTPPQKYRILFSRGDKTKGFEVLQTNTMTLLYVYNSLSEVILKDEQTPHNEYIIHIIFILLLLSQLLLYKKLQKALAPLKTVSQKLQELEEGDLTPLEKTSEYEEIHHLIHSYNQSIARVKQILEIREMFNKVFMHEMKTPLAKGMFYLKLEPSATTHEKLSRILKGLNAQLDAFSHIENLIVNQKQTHHTSHHAMSLLQEAIRMLEIEMSDNITIDGCDALYLEGNPDLWVLCFKNLIDNGLKYAHDKKLLIKCNVTSLSFSNQGDGLPLDISKEVSQWKIEQNTRYKSSTGYGFGLFIIKTIASFNGYRLEYNHYQEENRVCITILTRH
ncbi:MAG: HAMP domain-containing histidine kinase [Campylobacteraceae bacterium]|nr:HAMP domain-containing histidine kinase [Campylobacteraceae bacterium]